MNSLSWFLYFAGVADGVAGVFFFATAVSIVIILVCFVYGEAAVGDSTGLPSEVEKYYVGVRNGALKKVWIPIIICLFAALIPSSQTLYLIAGSELGETAINSPEAKALYEDIRGVIQSYSVLSETDVSQSKNYGN